jgi:SAM-dependent methyltransferase
LPKFNSIILKKLISLLIRKVPRKYLQIISPPFLKLLALVYAGNKVECPVCENKFSKFLPYGRQSRPNALCPSCLALERHRLMYLYLKDKTNFFSAPLKVLHIAPEACFIDRFEAMKNLDYITGDIESPLAKVKMDIHDIPFDDKTFDVVFCNHVMEHVTDDIKAMSELNRVLKPGGWGILQIPLFHPLPNVTDEDASVTDPAERERRFGQSDHVRLFGKDYIERLRKGGFQATEDDYINTLPQEMVEKYALPKDETIFLVHRAEAV